MAITNSPTVQSGQRGPQMEAGSSTHYAPVSQRPTWLETKPFAETSEFWMTIVGIIAVLIAGYVIEDPAFNLFRDGCWRPSLPAHTS
jgi:hypothetical protein